MPNEMFSSGFLKETIEIIERIDCAEIENIAAALVRARNSGGRLFVIGSGGGAAHASHAVNDFRKIAGMEAYTPTDNVAELTARINDDGWDTSYSNWLKGSHMRNRDVLMVLSVGGGDTDLNVSMNLVRCIQLAKKLGSTVCGVVGRDGGYTAKMADHCLVVPTVNRAHITAHTESFQAVVWHLLVSHPTLQTTMPKWESI